MKLLIPHFLEFISTKFPEFMRELENHAIHQYGSQQEAERFFKNRSIEVGELQTILEFLFPLKKWSEADILNFERLDTLNGLNDLFINLLTTDLGKTVIDFKSLDKTASPFNFILIGIVTFEWLDKKTMSLESLRQDLGCSKNTFRKKWLPFFFGKDDSSSDLLYKPHKFYGRRKISPIEYFEIFIAFTRPQIKNLINDKAKVLDAIRNGWMIAKSDLKKDYNIRSEALQIAVEDASEQPDFPKQWAGKIPSDVDKFPYSVGLFIARELELSKSS